MQVLIGGKDTESGRKAAACLADVYAHWVRRPQTLPDANPPEAIA